METSEIEVPLAESLANELVDFWERTFGALDDDFRGLLTGADQAQNRHLVYLARKGTSLAGTCHLTIGRSSKHLGGLGGVAVTSHLRRMGIASHLCGQARDTFRAQGGEALFLGTVNPSAERVYHRLGWKRLAWSQRHGLHCKWRLARSLS